MPFLLLQTIIWFFLLLFFFLPQQQVQGFVPPRDWFHNSSSSSWESVHAMRQRLGLQYNYTPSLLNPELCRYLSEDECEDADVSLQAHARQQQQLQFASRRQRQLQAPNTGVVQVLVILLQFPDHMDRDLPDVAVYEELWNSKGKSDLIPSGSVSQWFQKNSYGLYELQARIVPWTVSDESELYYSFGSSGLTTQFQQAFWPVLDQLDANGMDWSDYDLDGDGVLDAVTVLHTGYAAELKGVDCNTDREYYNRIWSHAYATSSFHSWTSADGQYRVGGYTVASAYRDTCGFEPARIGTMTHEFLHTLGLVDLYDGQDARVGRGVGGFDIMATPYGPKDDPSWPGHLSAWSRKKVGWLMPIEIVQDGEYSIQASELSNQAYAIRKKFPYDEYLLIENRQPIWFDSRLWTGGLVIYHIDDRATLQLKRGYPGQEGWPRNGNHYQVAVLASDGQYNLEKGDNVGDVGDFWKEGMTLGPGNGRVFPNTDAYQFGSIRVTGITIYDIQNVDSTSTVMTFKVSGLSNDDATEVPAPKPIPTTPNPTVAPADDKNKPTPQPTLPQFTDNILETTPTSLQVATISPDDNSTTIAKEDRREYQGAASDAKCCGVGVLALLFLVVSLHLCI